MAAIFEKPLPENPMLLESLAPWKRVETMKPVDHYSFTEIFGQLHLKENHVHDPLESSASSSPFPSSSLSSSLSSNSVLYNPKSDEDATHTEKKEHKRKDSICSMNSDCVSTCTEEVGFDGSDDVEDFLKNEDCNNDWRSEEERCTRTEIYENHWHESRRSSKNVGKFPPPISCIGRSGKPWVCFTSFREDGRFILKEIRIPTQEFLHACRKNGRLRMQFIQSDDEFLDADEDEEEEEEDEEVVEEDVESMVEDEGGDAEVTEA